MADTEPMTPQRSDLLPGSRSRLRSVGRMVLLAGLVGVAAGTGAVVFNWLCHVVAHYALDWGAGYREIVASGEQMPVLDHLMPQTDQPLRVWMLLIVLPVGGLVTGLLVHFLAREAEGPGTGVAIGAYHNQGGEISGRVGIIKIIASAVTLGTGGSGGREGPIGLVGASWGSYLADKFSLSPQERRILLVAGMGAGIGAFFRAPLAGAIFAVEVLYADPDFETGSLIPAFFATTTAYTVFALAFGVEPVFAVKEMTKFNQPALLLPLTALAGLMVVMSFSYVKILRSVRIGFTRLPGPRWIRPAFGALGAGVVAVGLYYALTGLGESLRFHSLSVLGYGYGFIQCLLDGMSGATSSPRTQVNRGFSMNTVRALMLKRKRLRRRANRSYSMRIRSILTTRGLSLSRNRASRIPKEPGRRYTLDASKSPPR